MEKAGENVEKPTYCGKQVESDENSPLKTRAEILTKGETEMNKKQKKMLKQIIAAVILVAILKLLPSFPTPVELVLYYIPYLVVGWDVLRKAIKGIKNRQPFDECFLMAVATVGAFALGDYVEGCAVIIFYQIGELFQSVAVGKSRRSISALMDIRPDYANIEGEDGKLEQVDPDEVEVGTVIVVQPGERVPIDGVIVEGASTLNTAALTGESLPRDVQSGDEVISGCVNMSGLLRVRTTKEFGESTVSKILDLVENSSMKKARAFFMLEFSTRSRILETVDSPNSLVVLTRSRPLILTQPLMTSSPDWTSRGRLSPVRAAVFRVEAPSTMTPSMGTRSPGWTTMTVPTSTSSGSTCSSLPSSPSMLA